MNKFNLDRALAGDKVIDGDGNEYKNFYLLKNNDDINHPVLAVRINKNGSEGFGTFTKDGRYSIHHAACHSEDLQMAPKTKKVWIAINKNINKDYGFYHTSGACDEKEHVIDNIGINHINKFNIIELEIEVNE